MSGGTYCHNHDLLDAASVAPVVQATGQAPPSLAPRVRHAPPEEEVSGLSPILPDELIVEILSRVPVRSLVQFRRVSKLWKSLIFDPHFVKKHLHRSTADSNFTHHRFLSMAATDFPDGFVSCSLLSLFSNSSTISEDLRLKCKYRIVGSCNGLVCLANDRGSEYLRLWNPSTGLKSKKLPYLGNTWLSGCYNIFGFGYDNLTDSYKLVSVFCNPNAQEVLQKTVVKVYTLGTNCWRQIQSFPYFPHRNYEPGKFVSGTLNWIATRADGSGNDSSHRLVVSLDLGKETYKEVLLPDPDVFFARATLGVLNDCLCVSYQFMITRFVVWVMKEYGVEESWTKLVTISYVDFEVVPMPLFMSEDGEVLLRTNFDELVVCSDNIVKCPRILSGKAAVQKAWIDPIIYVESLVSPFG